MQKQEYKTVIGFGIGWVLFWFLQSVLMSHGSDLKFYLLKNIMIVGLQFLVVIINLKLLIPFLLEKKHVIPYILGSAIIIYIAFTLTFPLVDLLFTFVYESTINLSRITLVTDYWRILSGSSFYSLALVISTLFYFYRRQSTASDALKEISNESPTAHNHNILQIKEGNKVHFINKQDILYIKGLREYVMWITETNKIVSLDTLKSIELKYDSIGFKRVHKSYIVNTSHISARSANHLTIQGEEIPIGRTYKDKLIT